LLSPHRKRRRPYFLLVFVFVFPQRETQMANKVTSDQQAMGFSIAAIVLAVSTLDAAIKRNDITADDARAVISNARKFLQHKPPGAPGEKAVFDLAASALQVAEGFLAMGAAGTPPQGPH
jgi:hypothetical protein